MTSPVQCYSPDWACNLNLLIFHNRIKIIAWTSGFWVSYISEWEKPLSQVRKVVISVIWTDTVSYCQASFRNKRQSHIMLGLTEFILHSVGLLMCQICSTDMNEWMMHLYSTLLCIFIHPKRFTIMWGGGLSSTTTSVQHPLGWCNGCHRTTAPVLSPHTSYRWRGERVKEPIKCMHSPHTSYRWRRESHRANQVYALTTHQLQVERRERVIEPIKCMCSPHTSYRWRGERVIETIKCTRSPHTS